MHNLRAISIPCLTGLTQLVALGAFVAAWLEIEGGNHGREGRGLFISLAAAVGLFVAAEVTRRQGEDASTVTLFTLSIATTALSVAGFGYGTFALAHLTMLLSLPVGVVVLAEYLTENDLHAKLLRAVGAAGTLLVVGCVTRLALV